MKKVLSAVIVTLLAVVLAACTQKVVIKDAKVVVQIGIATITANSETETEISFLIVEKGAKAPSADQVIAGKDYDEVKIVENGVFAAGKSVRFAIVNGDYTAYLVGVKDGEKSVVVSTDFKITGDVFEGLPIAIAEAKGILLEDYTRVTSYTLQAAIKKAELVNSTTGSTGDDFLVAYDELISAREGLALIEKPNTNVDRNGTYTIGASAVKNLNPLTSTNGTEGDLLDYFRGTFYETVLDWDKAVDDGIASTPWDFSKIKSEDDMAKFSTTKRPSMAASAVYGVNSETDATKKNSTNQTILDVPKAKETLDTKFRISIREDLEFIYGNTGQRIPIDTTTIAYSIKEYLNPATVNERANLIYGSNYINILNGEKYFKKEATWEEVGFKVIDKYTFEIEVTKEASLWTFTSLINLLDLVDEAGYENAKPAGEQRSNYGSVDNLPASYGRYIIKTWEADKELSFERNKNYTHSDEIHIKTIKVRIIVGQGATVSEFKDKKVDVAGVGGTYYSEFKDDPRLKVSKSNSFFRLDISIARPDSQSPDIIKESSFRKALYLAIDREAFSTNIVPPSQPLLSLASNIHQVSEEAGEAFHSSPEHKLVLEDLKLSPDTFGYNSVEANRLFLVAYDKMVAEGKISSGEKAKISFVYFAVDQNQRIADYLKGQLESVFGSDKFELSHDAKSTKDVFDQAQLAGNYDILYTGLSGGTFDVSFIYDFVYVQKEFYYSFGFEDLATTQVKPFQLENKVNQILEKAEGDRTAEEKSFLGGLDVNFNYKGTFKELANLYQNTSLFTAEYEGRTRDLSSLAATLERVLLEAGITIPLLSNVSAAIYQERVQLLHPYWNVFVGWGGTNARVVLK